MIHMKLKPAWHQYCCIHLLVVTASHGIYIHATLKSFWHCAQIQGIGSSATIVKSDLDACGPSVVYIIDHVLLPFSPGTSAASAPFSGSAPL